MQLLKLLHQQYTLFKIYSCFSVPPIGTNNLGTETPPLHIDMTNSMQEDMVGGTTYFYTQDEMQARSQGNNTVLPNFTVYPGMLPHMAHMKAKANQPSFFMPDDLKSVSAELCSQHYIFVHRAHSYQLLSIMNYSKSTLVT